MSHPQLLCCGFPIQGWVGWSPVQPELMGGSLAHGRVLEVDSPFHGQVHSNPTTL